MPETNPLPTREVRIDVGAHAVPLAEIAQAWTADTNDRIVVVS
jgi:hypothetical protein